MDSRPRVGAALFRYGASELLAGYRRRLLAALAVAVASHLAVVGGFALWAHLSHRASPGSLPEGSLLHLRLAGRGQMELVSLAANLASPAQERPRAEPLTARHVVAVSRTPPRSPEPARSNDVERADAPPGTGDAFLARLDRKEGGGNGTLGSSEPGLGDFVAAEVVPLPLTKVLPHYPEVARLAAIEGRVVVMALVTIDGEVRRAVVVEGPELLHQAALDAARRWTFSPAFQGGQAVAVWVAIPFAFRLEEHA